MSNVCQLSPELSFGWVVKCRELGVDMYVGLCLPEFRWVWVG